MNPKSFYLKNDGYTIIETLVALVLLISVLIPLCVTMGNLFLDRSADVMSYALGIAISEMSEVETNRDFTARHHYLDYHLVLSRETIPMQELVEVKITITSANQANKPVLTISKWISSRPQIFK